MTTLLERVRFLGGDNPEPEVPAVGGDGADLLDPDPAPGRKTAARPSTAAKSAASRKTAAGQTRTGGKFVSSAKVRDQMAEELDAYVKMIALTWSMSDEECAGVLNDTSAQISRDLAAVLSRSDWIVERFQATTLFADCMKLAHSLFPLLRTIYAHHVANRAQPEEYDREPVTVPDVEGYAPWRPAVA